MSTLVMGFALILLLAAVSVAVGAAARVVLGLLLPAVPPDDDLRWSRSAEGTRPADPAPRTPREAFERGSAAISRTLAPDAIVPIARLAPEGERPVPAEPSASDASVVSGASSASGGPATEDADGSSPDGDAVGRAIDRIAVRF
jgi:hypothetical protein